MWKVQQAHYHFIFQGKEMKGKTVSYDQNIKMICPDTLIVFLASPTVHNPSPSSIFILCIVSLGIKPTSLIMTRGLQV